MRVREAYETVAWGVAEGGGPEWLDLTAEQRTAISDEWDRIQEDAHDEIEEFAKQLLASAPSPEALDLRHAGHARILNPDEDASTPDGAYAADEPLEEE